MNDGEYNCSSELDSPKAETDPNTLDSVIQEDRRLMILLPLMNSSGYTLNSDLLKSLLGLVGHHASSHTLHDDCSWLEKHSLAKCEDSEFNLTILTLSQTGWDVAMGDKSNQGCGVHTLGKLKT